MLRFVQVFSGEAEVSANSGERTFGNVFAATIWNGCEGLIFGVPPDFVRTWSLANKFTTQLTELLCQ